jgi:hypothetical protein
VGCGFGAHGKLASHELGSQPTPADAVGQCGYEECGGHECPEEYERSAELLRERAVGQSGAHVSVYGQDLGTL